MIHAIVYGDWPPVCAFDVDEFDFEARGSGTIVVSSRCGRPVPKDFKRHIKTMIGPTSVHIHVCPELDASLPPTQLAPRAIRQLASLNDRDPRLFQRGGRLVHVVDGGLADVSPVKLKLMLAEAATWKRVRFDGTEQPVDPPDGLVKTILELGEYSGIREIERVVSTPVLAADGSVVQKPGYNAEGKLWYEPTADLIGLDVPAVVTHADVAEAVHLLRDDLLGDFAFADEASAANAMGALLSPYLRDRIEGPTPLHAIDAPLMGSGKGLLADAIAMPFLGRSAPSSQWASKEDEQRKSILSLLRTAPPFVKLDNVVGRVNSAAFNSALTEPVIDGRLLGGNARGIYAVRCIWLMTANNVQFVGDTTRRVVTIRLDAKTEHPAERAGPRPGTPWRHPKLRSWIVENRANLIRAALVLCLWWVQEGEPAPETIDFGSYEDYQMVVGGVLLAACVEGFLANRGAARESGDHLLPAALFEAWHDAYGREPQTSRQIHNDGRLKDYFADLDVAWRPNTIGTWLGMNRDVIANGRQLVRDGKNGRHTWSVRPVATP